MRYPSILDLPAPYPKFVRHHRRPRADSTQDSLPHDHVEPARAAVPRRSPGPQGTPQPHPPQPTKKRPTPRAERKRRPGYSPALYENYSCLGDLRSPDSNTFIGLSSLATWHPKLIHSHAQFPPIRDGARFRETSHFPLRQYEVRNSSRRSGRLTGSG